MEQNNGRVSVNRWKTFMEQNNDLKVHDRLLILFYYGEEKAWLFVKPNLKQRKYVKKQITPIISHP